MVPGMGRKRELPSAAARLRRFSVVQVIVVWKVEARRLGFFFFLGWLEEVSPHAQKAPSVCHQKSVKLPSLKLYDVFFKWSIHFLYDPEVQHQAVGSFTIDGPLVSSWTTHYLIASIFPQAINGDQNNLRGDRAVFHKPNWPFSFYLTAEMPVSFCRGSMEQ